MGRQGLPVIPRRLACFFSFRHSAPPLLRSYGPVRRTCLMFLLLHLEYTALDIQHYPAFGFHYKRQPFTIRPPAACFSTLIFDSLRLSRLESGLRIYT